jgi:hypothetical protein
MTSSISLVPRPKLLHLLRGKVSLSGQTGSSPVEIADRLEQRLSADWVGRTEVLGVPVHVAQGTPGDVLAELDADDAADDTGLGGMPVDAHPEAYSIRVSADGAAIRASTPVGRLHGLQTLAQLLWNYLPEGRLPYLVVADWPSLSTRGIHVCYHLIAEFMPDMAPNLAELRRRIALARHYKGNLLLLEIEALFPYRKHPTLPSQIAFTRDELRGVAELARERQLEILPLIQCLGHAYNVLRHPAYAHLREVVGTTQQYCPTNPDVRDFYMELVDELREVFPDMRGIHVGGDESRRLGVCPRCRDKVRRAGLGALYGEHVGEICRRVVARGLTPYLWADMLEHMPEVDWSQYLPRETVLVYWNYDLLEWPRVPAFDLLEGTGCEVITASAARFGTHNHTMYLYSKAMSGIGALTRETERHGLDGTIVTDWTKAVPHELSSISLVYGLHEAWGGAGSLSGYEQAFGRLHFGAKEAAARLAQVYRLLEPLVPFCEDAQTRMLDRLDRYDLSGLSIRDRIAEVVAQTTSEETRDQLESALERGRDALSIVDDLISECTRNRRELALLRLSARTQVHKARMGLAFIECARTLRYPAPGDAPLRERLTGELDALLAEWDPLVDETRALLLPGTFAETVEQVLEVKFEPEARAYMERFLGLLRSGGTVTRLL